MKVLAVFVGGPLDGRRLGDIDATLEAHGPHAARIPSGHLYTLRHVALAGSGRVVNAYVEQSLGAHTAESKTYAHLLDLATAIVGAYELSGHGANQNTQEDQ